MVYRFPPQLFLVFCLLQIGLSSSAILVDEIVAKVNSTNICLSDLHERQMQLGGKTRTLEQCIEDEIFMQKARDYGAVMSDDELSKRMVALRAGYGFGYKTQAEFEAFLKRSGLSTKRLRDQLCRSGSIISVRGALAPKDALVTRQDVEAYCAAHPLEKDVEYLLSFASGARDLLGADGDLPEGLVLSWNELDGWMRKADLAENMNFVKTMSVGQVSAPVLRDDTFFVYRLEKKNEARLFTVDERYAEVEKILLNERKAQKEVEVKERLKREAATTVLS